MARELGVRKLHAFKLESEGTYGAAIPFPYLKYLILFYNYKPLLELVLPLCLYSKKEYPSHFLAY